MVLWKYVYISEQANRIIMHSQHFYDSLARLFLENYFYIKSFLFWGVHG